jgi:hypothetical protein
MAKNTLSEEIKRFIVKSLAVYETPSEVMESVKAIFNKKVTRQNIHFYDPTKLAGEALSEELRTLFFDTRSKFDETEILPLSKKNVRIKKLSKYVDTLENNDNFVGAAEVIAQIAKEEGGMFTNRRELTGAKGGPVVVHSKTLDEWNKDAESRVGQAAEVMSLFNEKEQ